MLAIQGDRYALIKGYRDVLMRKGVLCDLCGTGIGLLRERVPCAQGFCTANVVPQSPALMEYRVVGAGTRKPRSFRNAVVSCREKRLSRMGVMISRSSANS